MLKVEILSDAVEFEGSVEDLKAAAAIILKAAAEQQTKATEFRAHNQQGGHLNIRFKQGPHTHAL